MANGLGLNLNPYQGLIFLTGASPEELHAQLMQITVPYSIVSIYGSGSKHVAWLDTGAIRIKKVTKKNKE